MDADGHDVCGDSPCKDSNDEDWEENKGNKEHRICEDFSVLKYPGQAAPFSQSMDRSDPEKQCRANSGTEETHCSGDDQDVLKMEHFLMVLIHQNYNL